MSDLLVYCLALYMVYHVLTRGNILARPRRWAAKRAPKWLLYIGGCPLCFTWWVTLALWVIGVAGSIWLVLAAPTVVMIIDGVVRALRRANEPPVICTTTAGPSSTYRFDA